MAGEPSIELREADLEHTVERYRAALDAGDAQGVAQILHEAIYAPELDRRISEVNLEAEREMYEEFYDEEKPRRYETAEASVEVPVYDPEDLIW